MPRRSSQTYRCEPLAELARQLLYAPPARRIEQARRAEALHDQLDPQQNYPFDFISYRVTGYRTDTSSNTLLIGQAILPDLRLMIDQLTHTAPIPVTSDDPADPPDEIARRLGVSTKTVARWRGVGLRWRWVIQPGRTRKTIALTPDAVEHFVTHHGNRVKRATNLTHIDVDTRQSIIRRAGRIAQATDATLNRVAAHLSKRFNRAHQTVRLILQHHDRDHPDNPLFAQRTGPLTRRQRRLVAHALRRGETGAQLVRRFNRTRSTIYRAARHHRTEVLRRLRIEYRHNPLFNRKDADQRFLVAVLSPQKSKSRKTPVTTTDDLPPQIAPMYRHPRPASDQLREILLSYNYLKFDAARRRVHLDRYDPRAADLNQIEEMIRRAGVLRQNVFTLSLPLTLSAARRHLISQPDRSVSCLVDLLVSAIPVLAKAIDEYDVSRDQDFDAYLTFLLMRHFAPQHSVDTPPKAHRKLTPQIAIGRLVHAATSYRYRLQHTPELSKIDTFS